MKYLGSAFIDNGGNKEEFKAKNIKRDIWK